MIRSFSTILLSLTVMALTAQSPADWWYFGGNAGIHFTQSGPVAVTNGVISTLEGCTSISDANGNFLFYTDGILVWDSTHTQMPNGSGLLGDPSSTQSAVIVPHPVNTNLYYVFTVDAEFGPGGFAYSLVDMTLNGGQGDVVTTEKNIQLIDVVSEKIAATAAPSGNKIWVYAQRYQTDSLFMFEVTSAGVNTTPNFVGHSYQVGSSQQYGYMKISPDGKYIALAKEFQNEIYLYEINANDGTLSNEQVIKNMAIPPYGIEFSANSQVLYAAQRASGGLYQYDISTYDSTAIMASETMIDSLGGRGAIQIGPDSKIYGVKFQTNYLNVIHEPNNLGTACNYQDSAVFLQTGTARLGLPPFIATFFNADFGFEAACDGDSIDFVMDTANVTAALWNFGDPASGGDNTSTLFFPKHLFTDTGSFTITLIATFDTILDTAIQEIYVYPRQNADLGLDTALCRGDSMLLDVSQPFSTFLWSDGSGADSLWVDSTDTVWVTVFGVCDTASDTVIVVVGDSIVFDLGPDTLLCDGVGFLINPMITVNATFDWSTGDSTPTLFATESDTYVLTASNACGDVVDSIEVTFKPVPSDSMLPPDTINCFDNEIVLVRPDLDSVTYVWSDSSTKTTYKVDTTETVWLAAFNECGFAVDTINIVFNGEILSELGEDTAICEGDSIALTAIHPGASYVWNTGEVGDTIWTDQVETFNYVVTVTYKDCKTIESKRVDMDDFYCPPIDCSMQYANTFSPNNDGVNDKFRPWSDCDIYSFSMYVYNRWGQLVHSDKHVQFGWDGFINGQPAPEGVYYFVIDFHDRVVVDEDRNIYQGSFTLVR